MTEQGSMQVDIFEQLKKLRNNSELNIDRKNSNRYSVIVREENGSHTAYCFACPVYNNKSKKLVDKNFKAVNNSLIFEGTNSIITVSNDGITLKRDDDKKLVVDIQLPNLYFDHNLVKSGQIIIEPGANGLVLTIPTNGTHVAVKLRTDNPSMPIRSNTKYFAYMQEQYVPFAGVYTFGTSDLNGNIIAPAMLTYSQSENGNVLYISPTDKKGKYVKFAIDMYEPKLYQDTTVEKANIHENNAFGQSGFIGTTEMFGEQWLYTRPDLFRIAYLQDRKIHNVTLYTPILGKEHGKLEMYRTTQRFCSFGSTWSNKVFTSAKVCESEAFGGYEKFNMTSVLVDKHTKFLVRTDGLIVRTAEKQNTPVIVATGDNSYKPQILAINFN